MLRAFAEGHIFGEPFGEGTPKVIWLHGWGRSSADFRVAGETLAARGVASLALDLPGFGASPAPDSPMGARGYAELIGPVVREATHGEPYVLVGHSFGGRIAAVLGSRGEAGLRGLVFAGAPLVARTTSPRRTPWPYRLVRTAAKWHLVSPGRLEAAKRKYGSVDYRNATGVMRDVLVATVNETYEAELAAITTPSIFVWGANDSDVPPNIAQRAAALVRRTPIVREIQGCGHLVPRDGTVALVEATVELL